MGIQELMIANPKLSLILVAALVTLVMTFINKKFTDQNRMKELKDIQKACRINLKGSRDNPKEMEKINRQMMECSMEMMKHSFKPILITFIPLIIFFWWLRGIFLQTSLGTSWIWWYISAGIISSIVFRKVLKVH